MNPTILALRAITSTFFRRIFVPVAWFLIILAILIWVGVIYLATDVHGAWWLAMLFVIPGTLILGLLLVVVNLLSKRLNPSGMTKENSKQVKAFVDKFSGLAEVRATPLPITAFLIGKDILRGKKSKFIENTISDTSSLKGDFESIKKIFS